MAVDWEKRYRALEKELEKTKERSRKFITGAVQLHEQRKKNLEELTKHHRSELAMAKEKNVVLKTLLCEMSAENAALFANLTSTQNRCTEFLLALRKVRKVITTLSDEYPNALNADVFEELEDAVKALDG